MTAREGAWPASSPAHWPAHWLDAPAAWPVQLSAAVAHARAAYPREACGFLEATGETVALGNRAACPDRAFEVTEVHELVALERACRRGPVVFYHSHPDGPARWSASDEEAWASAQGPLWPVEHLVLGVVPHQPVQAVFLRWQPRLRCFAEARRGLAEAAR